MFPLRGAENDIQNHLLFFIFLGQGPPTADVVGGFCFVFLFFIEDVGQGRHHAAALPYKLATYLGLPFL